MTNLLENKTKICPKTCKFNLIYLIVLIDLID